MVFHPNSKALDLFFDGIIDFVVFLHPIVEHRLMFQVVRRQAEVGSGTAGRSSRQDQREDREFSKHDWWSYGLRVSVLRQSVKMSEL